MTEKKESKKVLPGELVATAEEYMPGFGTFEDDGNIYSTAIGSLYLDERNKIARLDFQNPPLVAFDEDVVFCEVTDVKPSMVVCRIQAMEGTSRGITGETMGTLHVSKVSNRYVEDASEKFRITDIIRAEVIQSRPSIQLTTAKPHLGVIMARCNSCREPLDRKGNKLYCESCERTEYRKLAKDYRDVKPC